MKRCLVLVLTCLGSALTVGLFTPSLALAQPSTPTWRPPTGCTDGQAMIYNASTSRWLCGAAGSTYTAGDGLTLTGTDFDLDYTSDFQITGGQLDLSTSVSAPGTLGVYGKLFVDTSYSNLITIDHNRLEYYPGGGGAPEGFEVDGPTGQVYSWTLNDSSTPNLLLMDTRTLASGMGGSIRFGYTYTAGGGGFVDDGASIKASKENGTAGNTSTALTFSTKANGGSLTEKLRIGSTGNATIAGYVETYGGAYLGDDDSDRTVVTGYMSVGQFGTNFGPVVTVGYGGTAMTTPQIVGNFQNDATYDTTGSGGITNRAVRGLSHITKAAGADPLISIGGDFDATGGDTNIALSTDNGDVILNSISGSTTINGATAIGDNAADAHALLGTLNANSTAGSNGEILTIVSGVPKWAAAGSSISGLTTNRITKATSSTTIGDAAIYENNGAVEMGDTSNTAISNNLDVITIQQTGTGHTTNGLGLIKLNETGTYIGATSTATISYGAKLTGNVTCSDCTGGNSKVHASKILYVDSVGDLVGDNFTYGIALQTYRGDNYFNTDDASGTYFATGMYVNPTYGVTTSKVQPAFSGLAEVDSTADFDIGTNWGSHDGNLHLLSNGGTLYLNDTVNQPIDIGAGGTSADVTIRQDLAVVGTTDLRSTVADSTGALSLLDDVDIGASGTSTIAATNGITKGMNPYEGVHYEFTDEMFYAEPAAGQHYGPFLLKSGGGSIGTNADGSGRPGVVNLTTSTSATGNNSWQTSANGINLGGNTETVFEWVGNVATLSTSSEEFALQFGFRDGGSVIDSTDCVMAMYDRGNVAASGPNAANADKWSFMTCSNSSRTAVILDGTTQGGITTVNSPVAAGSWPSTNVVHIKVVVTAGTSAALWIADASSSNVMTLRATITTNIPSGTSRLVGAGFWMRKSVGTTARALNTDYIRLAYDLAAVRTP